MRTFISILRTQNHLPMTTEEKNRLMDDKWPEAYPNGIEAFRKFLKKASKAALFDPYEPEDEHEHYIIVKVNGRR